MFVCVVCSHMFMCAVASGQPPVLFPGLSQPCVFETVSQRTQGSSCPFFPSCGIPSVPAHLTVYVGFANEPPVLMLLRKACLLSLPLPFIFSYFKYVHHYPPTHFCMTGNFKPPSEPENTSAASERTSFILKLQFSQCLVGRKILWWILDTEEP